MTESRRAGVDVVHKLVPAILLVLVVAFAWLAFERRWANDDAYITFRYSQNLADGHGFVWNAPDGEPVEGTTSLGWTAIHAVAIALKIHPTPVAHMLGLLAGAIGLIAVYLAGRRFVGLSPGWALVAPALLFAHRQYVFWAVGALETRVGTAILLLATLLFAREATRDGRAWPLSGLLFFAATLFRPEMPLFHFAAGIGLLLARPSVETFRKVAASGGLHGALLALLTAWRLWLFGQPLPNTFYVKVGGAQVERGLEYLGQFFMQYHGALWAPFLIVALVAFGRRRVPLVGAFLVQIVLGVAWIVWSGGGRWEFRFFDPLLPAWSVTIAFATHAFAEGFHPERAGSARRHAIVGLVAAAIVVSQAWTLGTPFTRFREMMSVEELDAAANAMLTDGAKLAEVLGPEDRIAIGWAGAVPYLTRAWHFDPWGLNHPDARHWPFDEDAVLFHQRHATWDQIAAADVLAVDVFNQFLYRAPSPPPVRRLLGKLQPWAKEGVLVHCVELPGGGTRPWFWIFASPRSRSEIEAWTAERGLRLRYSAPLLLSAPTVLGAGE